MIEKVKVWFKNVDWKGVGKTTGKTALWILWMAFIAFLGLVLTIGVSVAKYPADTYILGQQVHRITNYNSLSDFSDEEWFGKLCIIDCAYVDMIEKGDVVEFADENGKPIFGEVYDINSYGVVICGVETEEAGGSDISMTEKYITMSSNSVRGIVKGELFGGGDK